MLEFKHIEFFWITKPAFNLWSKFINVISNGVLLYLQFDSRVMCMARAPDDVILMGTLSWMLYAYDSKTR